LSLSCVLCGQFCQFLWIVFVLCLVCPILSISLDCLCPVSCVSNTVSFSVVSLFCVLCAQYCQCLWIVVGLCLVYPILSVSLDCLFSVSCVSNTVSFSGLSLFCVLCAQYCQFFWIVSVLCLVCPILSVSLVCRCPLSCVPNTKLTVLGTQDIGQRQSRDTDSIGHTRQRTKTIQRNWQYWAHKTQDNDNPETLTVLGTQETG
jgi:hypothetical protein